MRVGGKSYLTGPEAEALTFQFQQLPVSRSLSDPNSQQCKLQVAVLDPLPHAPLWLPPNGLFFNVFSTMRPISAHQLRIRWGWQSGVFFLDRISILVVTTRVN